MRQKITREQFHELTRPLVGLTVSKTWRGYGSTIFLELGELIEHSTTLRSGRITNHIRGQATVMIEWDWRVERAQSIAFGNCSGERKITNGLAKLQGLRVVDVNIEGRLPELVVALSGNFWVHSFVTVESQPEWCLFLDSPRKRWIDSNNGKLRLTTKEFTEGKT